MTDDRIRKIQALIDHGATEGERTAAQEALNRLNSKEKNESIFPQMNEEFFLALTDPNWLRQRWHKAVELGRLDEYDILYAAIYKAGLEGR